MFYITKEIENKIIDYAEQLHSNPELSDQETLTTKFIKEQLSLMNIEIIDVLKGTGVIGLIKGEYPGKTVALRADIDALPIKEDESHKIRSKNEGVMHACGHDIHTAALLGAANALQNIRETLHGNVLLIFQPAEEISSGAKAIISSGIFDIVKPDAFFSIHVMPNIPADKVGVREGSIMAGQIGFEITVHGKGGHGASPQNACDPIIAAVRTVDALQSITARESDPLSPLVLSVCSIHSGTAINIIPNKAIFSGTCRYLDNSLSDTIHKRITDISTMTAQVHNCKAEAKFFRSLPALDNSPLLLSVAQKSGHTVFGNDNMIVQNSTMASEDFALFSNIAPTFMYHVGIGGQYPLHNCHLQIPKHTASQCAELFTQTVLTYLSV